MTRDEARKAAEVMLHYANGGAVELATKGTNDWSYEPSPSFDSWASMDYRKKPEPREFWVNIYDDNDVINHAGCVYLSKEKADKNAGRTRIHCIKVREVLDEE